jgi:hypothetical protein
MTATISPRATDRLAARSAGVWPNERTTFLASIRPGLVPLDAGRVKEIIAAPSL